MANYYAAARSNYFAVKDEKVFREWAARAGLTVLEPDHQDKVADGIRRFGISPGARNDNGGWPPEIYNEDTGECRDFDLPSQLSAHLADGEVAILMEVGNEALQYVNGTVIAVNGKGRTVTVDLDSIYKRARKLGTNPLFPALRSGHQPFQRP